MSSRWTVGILVATLVALIPATGCANWPQPAPTASAPQAQPEVIREVVYQPQPVYIERPAPEPSIVNTATTGDVNVSVVADDRPVYRGHRRTVVRPVYVRPRFGHGLRRVLRIIAPRPPHPPPRHGRRGPGRGREPDHERGRERKRERGGHPDPGPPGRGGRGRG